MNAPFPKIKGVRFALIPCRPGYAASSDGNIWSRWSKSGGFKNVWRKMKPHFNHGYRRLTLRVNRRRVMAKVSRLVLLAFKGKPKKGLVCCHRDGVRTNDRNSNLRWGTMASNYKDRDDHGGTARGEKNGNAMLTDKDAAFIRKHYKPKHPIYSCTALAKRFGVTKTPISLINVGKGWRHLLPKVA